MITVTKNMSSSDYQLAKVLQEQFQNEYDTEKSADGLAYKKPRKHNLNSSKCLVDPSWEVIDPTPDIHILFMAFNERFFWNKLLAVCVSWSKRMTTCAGICSYQGRAGMCSITLSEPLLKLRPRRDLVETLLHEMIHAFLFVTHNNRDRDGHGPEFHKHMYRINIEAGTNITVYHDFHDEVRLYKQHWWKCDGPCQNWKPYFGLVKRAMNRAPGPTDRWWGEHSRSCGGNFIKIKEPEKPVKTKKSDVSKKKPETVTKPLPDIRNHLVSNSNTQLSSKHSNSTHTSSITTIKDLTSSVATQKSIQTTSSGNTSTKSSSSTKTSITTINDLSSPNSKVSPVKSMTSGFPNTPGRTLSDSSVSNKDYSFVRNHWLKKFSNSTINNGVKKPSILFKPSSTPKKQLSSSNAESSSSKATISSSNILKRSSSEQSNVVPIKIPKLSVDLTNSDPNLVECPICLKTYKNEDLNYHLDKCLNETKPCIVCDKNIPQSDYEDHVNDCCNNTFGYDAFSSSNQQKHDVICFADKKKQSVNDVAPSIVKFEQCSVCDNPIETSVYGIHLNDCLQKMYQGVEDTYVKAPSSKCPVCEKTVPESDLSGHLENCRDLSDIFEDKGSVPTEEDEENKENNCPICSKLVNIIEINSHIDVCLNIAV